MWRAVATAARPARTSREVRARRVASVAASRLVQRVPTQRRTPIEPPTPTHAPTARLGGVPWRPLDVGFLLALALVTIASVFENFSRLAITPLHFDEGIYATSGWRYLHWDSLDPATKTTEYGWNNFEHPPLAKLLFGAAQVIAGHESITA